MFPDHASPDSSQKLTSLFHPVDDEAGPSWGLNKYKSRTVTSRRDTKSTKSLQRFKEKTVEMRDLHLVTKNRPSTDMGSPRCPRPDFPAF